MRYVIVKNGAVVVDKNQFTDGPGADSAIAQFAAIRKDLIVTEVDQTVFDATVVPIDHIAFRVEALSELATGTSGEAKLARAILLVILDEINVIRGLLSPVQPPRTANQLKNAIQTKINAGTAD